MRVKLLVLLALIGTFGCQDIEEGSGDFRLTKLGVSLEETNTALALNSGDNSESVTVSTVELWCDDNLEAELSFDSQQSIEVFSNIEGCYLRLTAFKMGENEYKIEQAYTEMDGVYYFSFKIDNEIEDQRLVRAWQYVENAEIFTGCKGELCNFYESQAKFQYSVLNIDHVVFENDVTYSKLSVGIAEELPPTCDGIDVGFVESRNENGDTLNLQIDLSGCVNSLDFDGALSFGLKAKSLHNFQSWLDNIQIDDAMDILSAYPVSPNQDGSDYKIVLSLEQIQDLLGGSPYSNIPNAVAALLADYILVVSNEGGISALVYGIENKCSSSEES